MKIITVIGARPQFIKAAVVSRILRKSSKCREILLHTGQHYDDNMSDIFFRELGIPHPDYNLNIGSGQHGTQTGKMLGAIEEVLLKQKPDWVLVYGDTNSTLAGALAAVKLHIPVAHIEAGLRSFNRNMPEEINRVLTDHAADLLFAPTKTAVKNLKKEGVPNQKVCLVGDVMYDAALYYGKKSQQISRILEKLHLKSNKYILSTIHRAENTDDPKRLNAIISAFKKVSQSVPIVLPLHPRTQSYLKKVNLVTDNFKVIDPVGYLDMVMLEKNSCLIATDSGGVQKEAFFYRVPCVTLRDETEWVELVQNGWNFIVKPNSSVTIAKRIMTHLGKQGRKCQLYGNGNAGELILKELLKKKK